MSIDSLSDDDYARLARHIAGEGSPEERAETERWITVDPSRKAAAEAMQIAWRTPLPEVTWDVDRAWGSFSAKLGANGTLSPRQLPHPAKVVPLASRRRWWQDSARVMQAAAAAVVILGAALWLQRSRTEVPDRDQLLAVATGATTTKAGERRTVTLPDGSTAVLGVSSTLRTRAGFETGAREVELEGEAFFTVKHDEAHPFRVIVHGTVVEDLGTEFAVRSYGASSQVRVAVASGSVAVRRGSTSDTAVVLEPRDVATIGVSGTIDVSRGIDVSPFTAFTTGRLIFVDTPLSEVVDELARWYGIQAQITDSALSDRHLTTTFDGESLDEVLRIISMSLDVRFVRNGNRVEFMGKSGVSAVPSIPASSLAEAGA